MSVVAVMAAELRRLTRDRTALFFMVALPIVVILLIGVTVSGGDRMRVAVLGGHGALGSRLVAALVHSPTLSVRTDLPAPAARTGLRRGEFAAVVTIPPAYDELVLGGAVARVTVQVQRASSTGLAASVAVAAAASGEVARLHAARFATRLGRAFEPALLEAGQAARVVPAVTVATTTTNASSNYLPLGFSYSAPTMLVLFVFINALAGGAAIIQSRRLGMLDRALAGPAGAGQLVLGETGAFFLLALLQSALIVAVGALVFGVSWGDPVAAATLVSVWALVGTGAGVLSGTLFRTPEQASSIGPAVGIAAGMLGGCMWPLEIVPSTLRTIGHAFPHAWAVDAWTEILSRGGGLGDIGRQLEVLAGFAVVLLVLAAWRLRRRLAG